MYVRVCACVCACVCMCVYVSSLVPVFIKLLEWTDLSVRVAVGTCIALLFELARDCPGVGEELLDSDDATRVYDAIQQLATESDRHTTRKDRNHTRSCFRDVLLCLDVRMWPSIFTICPPAMSCEFAMCTY